MALGFNKALRPDDLLQPILPGLQSLAQQEGASRLGWEYARVEDGFYFSLKYATFSREFFVSMDDIRSKGTQVIVERLRSITTPARAVRNLVARSRRFKSRRNSIRWRAYARAIV